MAKKIGLSCATLLLCAMAQARPHAPKSCTREYTVNPGDTCDGISAHQQVSTYQLASLNKKINSHCTNLVVGDVLCLGLDTKDCTTVQVVQPGDICAKIAQQAGIAVSDLQTNNPNINQDCTNIYVGEVLCVAPLSNSTTTGPPGAAVLPLSSLSDLGPPGAATPSDIPIGLGSLPSDSGMGSGAGGVPLGLNNPTNSGANPPDLPLGVNVPTDSSQSSPGIPLPLLEPNSGPVMNNPNSTSSGSSTIPIPLGNLTSLPGLNATSNSNVLPPLNISSSASGTPFNITIPEAVDSSHSAPSGPGGGINVGNGASANPNPSLGLPGAIDIGPKSKKTNGPLGLFPS